MAKLDPFNLKRPERTKREYTFVENAEDENSLSATFVLQKPHVIDAHKSVDLSDSKIEQYIKGNKEQNIMPVPFPAIDGEIYDLTPSICNVVASIVVMQCPENPADAYDFDNIVALSITCPNIFEQLIGAVQDINRPDSKKKPVANDTEQ